MEGIFERPPLTRMRLGLLDSPRWANSGIRQPSLGLFSECQDFSRDRPEEEDMRYLALTRGVVQCTLSGRNDLSRALIGFTMAAIRIPRRPIETAKVSQGLRLKAI